MYTCFFKESALENRVVISPKKVQSQTVLIFSIDLPHQSLNKKPIELKFEISDKDKNKRLERHYEIIQSENQYFIQEKSEGNIRKRPHGLDFNEESESPIDQKDQNASKKNKIQHHESIGFELCTTSSGSNQNPEEEIDLEQIEVSVPELMKDVDSLMKEHTQESPEEIGNWIRIKTLANSRYHLFKAGLSSHKALVEHEYYTMGFIGIFYRIKFLTRFEFVSGNNYFFTSQITWWTEEQTTTDASAKTPTDFGKYGENTEVQCKLCGDKYPYTHMESHVVGVHGLDGPIEMYIEDDESSLERSDAGTHDSESIPQPLAYKFGQEKFVAFFGIFLGIFQPQPAASKKADYSKSN